MKLKQRAIKNLSEYNIKIDFFNNNPEAKNTEYGDFTVKPYYNILLDDKAGFDPEEDWRIIYNFLKK